MAIDFAPPSPDLSPPQITPATYTSPLQSAQALQTLRNTQAQNAQQQAQTAQTQAVTKGVGLQNTQTGLDIQSQQGLMQAYRDNNGDVNKTLQAAPGYNVLPKDSMGFATNMANLAKTRAETDTATLAATDKMHDLLNQSYQPLFNEPDPAKRAAMLPGINQSILQQSPGIKPNELLQSADDQTIQHAQAAYTTQQWIKTQADALKDKATAAQTNQETADKQRASAVQDYQAAAGPDGTVSDPQALARLQQQYPKIAFPTTPAGAKAFIGSQVPVEKQPEYGIGQMQLAGAQNMTPQSLAAAVGGSIDQTKYPDQYQRTLNDAQNAVRFGLGAKGVQAAIKDGSDRVSQRENAISTAQVTSIPFREQALQNQQFQQGQQSYQFHAAELDRLAQPVTESLQTTQRLNDTLAQGTPQSDALVGAQLVRMVSGAQGSLAGTVPLVEQAVGGRSHWQDLQAAIQKWSTDPNSASSITPEQRQQIHSLADAMTQRTQARQQILMQGRSALAGASGPAQHRAILADVTNKLGSANIAAPSAAPGAGALPQGAGKVIDTTNAAAFIQAANGDKAKGRFLAQQNGWKLQ